MATTLDLFRNGAVGFIDWLDACSNYGRSAGVGRGLGVGIGLDGVGRIPKDWNVQLNSTGGPQSNAPAGICMLLVPATTGDVLK